MDNNIEAGPGDRGMDEQIETGWWTRKRLLLIAALLLLSMSMLLIYQILNAGTATNVDSDRLVISTVEEDLFQVDMHFTGEAPEDLRRGQTLRIRLQLGNSSPALLLDRGGFYQQTGGNWVYKLTDNGDRAERQPIEIGRQNPDHFEIVSGLESGDNVIISSYEPFGENETLNLQ